MLLSSLALVFLLGLFLAFICQTLGLPRLVGMLLAGIVLGPFGLHMLDSSLLSISADLRQMALLLILIKAGLSLHFADLKAVGRPAVLLSFVPASFEILAFILFAPAIFGITRSEAAVMGAVLSAVSPAVVVPRMVRLMDTHYGTGKYIPQMILAGASCDDVFVIVVFSAVVGMAQGGSVSLWQFTSVPVSIVLGILLGIMVGWIGGRLFQTRYHQQEIPDSIKLILILSLSFLLLAVEEYSKGIVPLSGLLAVVSMACTLNGCLAPSVVQQLAHKTGELWIAAEVLLFVLVGAAVDIRYTLTAGWSAIGMLVLALAFRAVGVLLCMLGTPLNRKERTFCVIAYLPKATVQAAIGSVPLSLGLLCGKIVLSVAVIGILLTAPLGAFGIDHSYRVLLENADPTPSESLTSDREP